jgi:hypothetical protein
MVTRFRKKFGVKFFEVDIMDETGKVITRVGTAKMRVIRRQANTVKVAAKRSMRRGKVYRSEAEMPPHVALTFRLRRQAWHIHGEDPATEPKVNMWRQPSAPGHPPNAGLRPLLKKFLFAQSTGKKGKLGGSYVTGPILLNRFGARPKTVPEVHEYSGQRRTIASIHGNVRTANFPKRPYMIPALKRVAPTFAKMWKDQVKP